VQNKLPKKLNDPGLFILPWSIGNSKAFDTLADLGSSINLLPLSLHKSLNLGKIEPTETILGLADGSIAYPVGIMKDMVVHVGRLTLLADFHVLDMNKDPTCPLLVGRGFLATASAIIDCKMSKIVVGEGSARSIYHVKKHSYYNEGEKIPYEIMLDRKPSRYGPWTNRDFVGPRRPFYLEETFVSNSTLNQQQLARDIEVNPFEDTLVFRKMTEFLGTLPINLSMNWWKGESEKAKYN